MALAVGSAVGWVAASVAVGEDGDLIPTRGSRFRPLLKEVIKCGLGTGFGIRGHGMHMQYLMGILMQLTVTRGELCPKRKR